MSTELPYRPCVGIALFNEQGHVFVGERIDTPGAWQMPQGGIDEGEDLEKAFYRELYEEIGTDKASIIRVHEQKLRYKLPERLINKLWDGKFGGQEQTWIAARYEGQDTDININAHREPEFQNWQWISLHQVLDVIVPFKRDTYKSVIKAFEDIALNK
jgi:putative (di)nucleoside polyphosphate hydrolase